MNTPQGPFAADNFFRQALARREQESALRVLSHPGNRIDFCSNDYLGLARSRELTVRITEAAATRNNGSGGSRLLAGNSALAEAVETELAQLYQTEAALLFNSGYTANIGFFQAVANRHATILYDERIHASVREGIRLSPARSFSFRHNDVTHLHTLLQRTEGLVFVAAEAIYSMDGDRAPLANLVTCCTQAGAHLVLDEAHSTGTCGPLGEGLAVAEGVSQHVFARLHTFGKAAGCHGAVWVGSHLLRNYLINFSRAFIYTTALPPHALLAIREACRWMAAHPELRENLQQRIAAFRTAATAYPALQLLPSDTAIQGLLLPGNAKARTVAQTLQQQGVDVRAVLSPTVPTATERIRVCLHVYNSITEIQEFVAQAASIC